MVVMGKQQKDNSTSIKHGAAIDTGSTFETWPNHGSKSLELQKKHAVPVA